MEISKISYVAKIGPPSFKQEAAEKAEKKEYSQDNKKLLLSLGGLAVLGLAAAGIAYSMRKGKVDKKSAEELGAKVKEELNPNNEKDKVIKITIDAFKKQGNKFEEGKALLADGNAFTGFIEKTNKNADSILIEYADGVLVKAVKNEGKDIAKGNFVKNYKYDKNGSLESVELNQVTKDGVSKKTTLHKKKTPEGEFIKKVREKFGKEIKELGKENAVIEKQLKSIEQKKSLLDNELDSLNKNVEEHNQRWPEGMELDETKKDLFKKERDAIEKRKEQYSASVETLDKEVNDYEVKCAEFEKKADTLTEKIDKWAESYKNEHKKPEPPKERPEMENPNPDSTQSS